MVKKIKVLSYAALASGIVSQQTFADENNIVKKKKEEVESLFKIGSEKINFSLDKVEKKDLFNLKFSTWDKKEKEINPVTSTSEDLNASLSGNIKGKFGKFSFDHGFDVPLLITLFHKEQNDKVVNSLVNVFRGWVVPLCSSDWNFKVGENWKFGYKTSPFSVGGKIKRLEIVNISDIVKMFSSTFAKKLKYVDILGLGVFRANAYKNFSKYSCKKEKENENFQEINEEVIDKSLDFLSEVFTKDILNNFYLSVDLVKINKLPLWKENIFLSGGFAGDMLYGKDKIFIDCLFGKIDFDYSLVKGFLKVNITGLLKNKDNNDRDNIKNILNYNKYLGEKGFKDIFDCKGIDVKMNRESYALCPNVTFCDQFKWSSSVNLNFDINCKTKFFSHITLEKVNVDIKVDFLKLKEHVQILYQITGNVRDEGEEPNYLPLVIEEQIDGTKTKYFQYINSSFPFAFLLQYKVSIPFYYGNCDFVKYVFKIGNEGFFKFLKINSCSFENILVQDNKQLNEDGYVKGFENEEGKKNFAGSAQLDFSNKNRSSLCALIPSFSISIDVDWYKFGKKLYGE